MSNEAPAVSEYGENSHLSERDSCGELHKITRIKRADWGHINMHHDFHMYKSACILYNIVLSRQEVDSALTCGDTSVKACMRLSLCSY